MNSETLKINSIGNMSSQRFLKNLKWKNGR